MDAPWNAARAAEYDSVTLESWAQANLQTEAGKTILTTAVQPNWGAEPRDLSLLYVLFYIAAAGNEKNPGNLLRLITTGGGAQESRLDGGTQLISIRMAKALGNRVELGVPVRGITQRKGGVQVHADGLEVHAKRVIVAIPPTLTGQIEYHPALPLEARTARAADAAGHAHQVRGDLPDRRSGATTTSRARRYRTWDPPARRSTRARATASPA